MTGERKRLSTPARGLLHKGDSAIDKTVIKLDPELGRALKAHCALRAETMLTFVSRLIWDALPEELRPERRRGDTAFQGPERRKAKRMNRRRKPRQKRL